MSQPLNLNQAVLPMDALSGSRRLTPKGRMSAVSAVLSKIVPDLNSQRFGQGFGGSTSQNRVMLAPDMGLLTRISDLTANDVNDGKSIFQILPEIELSMQILVSSILSPKDMSDASVTFSLDANRFNSELAGSMLGVVTEHFEKIYKISEMLQPALENMLFLTGADPMLILPESAVDRAINNNGRVSMESIIGEFDIQQNRVKPIGFLGNRSANGKSGSEFSLGLESLFTNDIPQYDETVTYESHQTYTTIVDNPNILKLERLKKQLLKNRTHELLSRRGLTGVRGFNVSQENYTSYQRSVTAGRAVQNGSDGGRFEHAPIQIMPTASSANRPTVGHPLVMRLPTESVIPVHQPSNPEAHLGYFIMLDDLGNPINRADERDYYSDMSDALNGNSSMASQLIAQVNRQFQGQNTNRQAEIDEMARIYGQFMEKELVERLQSGAYGSGVELTAPSEVYRVMLARSLAHRHTQVLYVPAELMVYFAFDYNKYGIGQSLLQQSKILGGIRVMMLFADTMAAIKNSVNHTTLSIELDETDPNPTHTVEFLMGEFAKTRQGIFPLGASSPTDVISYLQRAAVNVVVNGNTRYPTTKMDVSERASNRIEPNPELQKDLRDRHLMSIGLTPDQVDGAGNAEFATSILSNNLLLAKRVLRYQKKLEALLVEFVQKYILADGDLMDELRELVENNRQKLTAEQQKAQNLTEAVAEQKETLQGGKERPAMENMDARLENLETMGHDAVIMEFLQCICIRLPKPDMSTLKSQMDAYKEQEEAYDLALGAYVNPAYLEATGLGGMSDMVDFTKDALKAELMRDWMRSNNVMPELSRLVNMGDDDDTPNYFKNITDHVKSLSGSFLRMLYHIAKIRGRNDPSVARLKKILEESGEDVSSSDSWGTEGSYNEPTPAGGDSWDTGTDPLSTEEPAIPDDVLNTTATEEATTEDDTAPTGDEPAADEPTV